jgi:diaminopimelate decarboxylase
MPTSSETSPWWQRRDLRYDGGKLMARKVDLEAAARRHGTPLYVYDPARVRANLRRLREALDMISAETRVFYAMKANRFPPLLREMCEWGECGIDVCSPGELLLAREIGFAEERISYTGVGVSEHDLKIIGFHPGSWFNCDSQSIIRRFGARFPGRTVGIRINTGRGIGYRANPLLEYAGETTTKFGIYRDEFEPALALASDHGLEVVGLHLHHGCGYLTEQLPDLEEILAETAWFAERVPALRYINIGGGLGIPLTEDDAALDLDAWAGIVERQLGRCGAEIWIEPGDYLVKDAGVLLLQVTAVERKRDVVYVYVDGGFNTHIEPAFYNLPLHIVPCRQAAYSEEQKVTVAGNINESLDVFASEASLPPIEERQYLAFLNAGGYGSSMASNHCLRGRFEERLLSADGRSTSLGTETSAKIEPASLTRRNLRAWDALYGQSKHSVWGTRPIGFLAELIGAGETDLGPESRVLDAGTGEGRNLGILCEIGARVFAIDGSRSALSKVQSPGSNHTHLVCGDLTRLPLASASIDFVLLFDVIETMPEADALLGELSRILRSGARLLCNIPGLEDEIAGTDMTPISDDAFLYQHRFYYSFRNREDAISLLERNGFAVRLERLCHWAEAPHPGFRDEEHRHISRVFLAEKVG